MTPFDSLKRLLDLFRAPGSAADSAADADGERRLGQVAAIALRSEKGVCEILLVTSRDTGRWIVPKGWIEPGEDGAKAALREAWEEAGIRGDIAYGGPIGQFSYVKQRTRRGDVTCTVDVYLISSVRTDKEWPEKNQRIRRWFPVAIALDMIGDVGLRPVVRQAVLIHKAA
ncbi:8-oxo-dGTP pyrophosphatase MutT (NUDIX family) [Hoeflea marina]|uniref:8-oxo-dGTP pyrophosphatase MutT (NUDIX family) n=1 Tax=Hoeflea marina TaxID=274592 RepID=A0A317PTD9_9HYPH|nr:NUDIX hydrolase [Hoeflea marina]PWW03506.1 8-oxo-dGTP pyrophosphatase MutT (NUDIX family) [Hoeflea marina]